MGFLRGGLDDDDDKNICIGISRCIGLTKAHREGVLPGADLCSLPTCAF